MKVATNELAGGEPKLIQARVALHFVSAPAEDEPFELDVDVTVDCSCGHQETKRDQVYKPDDWVDVLCYACGATYRVQISTRVEFVAKAELISDSVLTERPEQGRSHV